MCGIVAYIGNKQVTHLLINGLLRMEYRGYDSAGISYVQNNDLTTIKQAGKVAKLDSLIDHGKVVSNVGIAHTRWATHGEPNNINAHPHLDNSGKIAVAHNGIIENYSALKKQLTEKKYTFKSDTDSEVLAVLIGAIYEQVGDLEKAVRLALKQVDGTFGIAVVSSYDPDKFIVARRGSPIVLGIGDGEFIAASDASAIVQHTRQVIYLDDNEMAIVKKDGFVTKTIDNEDTKNSISEITLDIDRIEKDGFDYFMLKEIYEQGKTFEDAFRGRLIAN
ncbi:MAG: class II glutamine amidotransferase, partial [Candidatus Kapabacteria bacterium]|nr:class II glutamine amidotransferase [Candidatus Kapabacteria bacterium]